ncbi:hypothetical protein [uncultured Granulicatella sp.]|uniref:hypothetical protein n=1 Tax=uncultured Granulicatella sp. TaxID=316089 RepID=UPI0028EBF848|nr:hypothetical protein [uncultured Granulicatella sp.]
MLQNVLTNYVAENVINKIDRARLNNTTVVTIRKQRTDNNVLIDFQVPDGIREISKIEILDNTSQVLSRMDLYVPIETNTRFKYKLEVRTNG